MPGDAPVLNQQPSRTSAGFAAGMSAVSGASGATSPLGENDAVIGNVQIEHKTSSRTTSQLLPNIVQAQRPGGEGQGQLTQ